MTPDHFLRAVMNGQARRSGNKGAGKGNVRRSSVNDHLKLSTLGDRFQLLRLERRRLERQILRPFDPVLSRRLDKILKAIEALE